MAFELACGLIRVKQNLEGKKGEKKGSKGDKILQPLSKLFK